MKLSGFNYIGKYQTTVLANGDSIHTIYVLDNNICLGLCRSKYKRESMPWYVAYGLNPFTETYIVRHIEEYPDKFETYQDAKYFIENTFHNRDPQILVNNHIADRIANVYAQYCMVTTGRRVEVELWRGYQSIEEESQYFAPLAEPSDPTGKGWLHSNLSSKFLASDTPSKSVPTLQDFYRICEERWRDYADVYVRTKREMAQRNENNVRGEPHRWWDKTHHAVNARTPVKIDAETPDEMYRFLCNQNGYAAGRCDPDG